MFFMYKSWHSLFMLINWWDLRVFFFQLTYFHTDNGHVFDRFPWLPPLCYRCSSLSRWGNVKVPVVDRWSNQADGLWPDCCPRVPMRCCKYKCNTCGLGSRPDCLVHTHTQVTVPRFVCDFFCFVSSWYWAGFSWHSKRTAVEEAH